MGGMRDIMRAVQLKQDYDNYVKWQRSSSEAKKAAYKSASKPAANRVKTDRIDGWLLPFNYSDRPGLYFQCKAIKTTQTGTGSDLAATARAIIGEARVLEAAPTGPAATVIEVPKYNFAKIYLSAKTGAIDDDHKSRLTQRAYNYQASNNTSCPFGRIDADKNFQDAVNAMRTDAQYKTFTGVKGQTVRFTPEG